jgi:hypothetical protein
MSTTLFSAQLTSAGFVRVPMTSIKAAIDALYKGAYGDDADLDARGPDGQISGGLSEMFDDLNGIAEDTVLGLTDPNAATGQMLSGLMILTGCPRNGASRSTAPALFVGSAGTVIDTTKVVQSTEDSSLWSPVASVTIPAGGSIEGTLQCNVVGPPASGRVPAGTLTKIQTPVDGWTGVTNAVGVPGYNVEGDPNGRVRRQQAVAIASQAMTDGLQAALKTIPHVLDAVVWENDKGYDVTVGAGNVIKKNSLRVFVRVDAGSSADPAITSSTADPVANMIFQLKGHGCGTQGDVQKFSNDAVGNSHEMRYDLATALPVLVAVVVSRRYNWPQNGATLIANAITSWASGTNPDTGKPNIQISGNDKGELSWTDVLASFVNAVPGFDFVSLRFSADAGSTLTTSPASLHIPFGAFVEITGVTVGFA